jgi:hypothetical protein
MDNNMIHIDDLVRQRLRGGEEPERPGAWMNMRELLDKEMPVATGTNWRRIIGYFTAALLLTTASVGGYHLYNTHISGPAMVAGGGGSHITGSNTGSPNTSVSAPTGLNAAAEASQSTSNNNTTPSSTTTDKNTDTKAASSNYVASNVHKPATGTTSDNGVSARSADKQNTLQPAPARSTATSTHGVASTAYATPGTASTDPAQTNNRMYASATTRARRVKPEPTELSANTTGSIPTASGSAAGPAITAKPSPASVKYQAVEQLELVHRRVYDAGTDRTYYRIDTVPMGRFLRETVIAKPEEIAAVETPAKPDNSSSVATTTKAKPATTGKTTTPAIAMKSSEPKAIAGAKENLTNASSPVVPAASMSSKTTEESVGSSVSSLGVKAVKSKSFQLWNAEKFEMAVEKVKNKLASIDMYPGIMAGINASMFTPNALGGAQLGLTSLFALNDWWSVMVELKYIHRFNTGSSVRDDYKNVISGSTSQTTINNEPYTTYTWSDQTVKHNFNYEVVRTWEMPLMLRYSAGQFYTQGGVNLVYSPAIAAREVTSFLTDTAHHQEHRPGGPHTPEKFVLNDGPTVKLTDFGSRFGTGFVLSGGYMFSPAVYVDARITGTVWDNSKTTGAKQISRDLLRTPSIQLSVGYRFNAKK